MKTFINLYLEEKTMHKVFIAALLIGLIAACTPKDPDNNINYRTGTEGLVVQFAKDSPPAKVYKDSKLYLVLEVHNKGAYSRPGSLGTVYLHGFEPNAISISGYDTTNKYASYPIPETSAKSPYLAEGGYNLIEVEESGPVKVPFGDSTNQKIMATTCYEYQTVATPSVCVVSNPAAMFKDKVCEPKTVTMTNQGAPVAVTKVQEEAMENALNFIITVQNVGGGRIVNLDALSQCPMRLNWQNTNYVNFEVGLSSYKAECTPSDGKVRLIDNKGVIFCKFPVELQTSYLSPLNIILNYGYSSSITRDVQIVNPAGSSYKPPAAQPGAATPSSPSPIISI
jgi:hypothetical protein